MAITDAQKVDLLYKKIGFGVAKTDTSAFKSPSNEANASPLLTRGDSIWVESALIPAVKPASNSSVLLLYEQSLSSAVECTLDTTVSGTNRTWLTNYTDWISSEFGSSYQVKIFAAPAGNTSPETYGTQLFADGSGNADSWYFDYQAGILNFPDTNVPSVITGKKIYVIGARYVGLKGIGTLANLNIGNLAVDTITINNASILGGYLSNISNITAITANLESLYSAVLNVTNANLLSSTVGNLSTANALITSGTISNVSAQVNNFSSGNVFISGGILYNIDTQANNFSTANALITGGNIYNTDAQVNSFSTANALVSGGIVYNVDIQANNFSTANALIVGGVIYNTNIQANNFSTANALITGGDISNVNAQINNFSTGNALISGGVVYNINVQANNFSTANALITGGYLTGLANITATTANIANISIEGNSVSSTTGNLILSPLLSNANAVVVINGTSALQLPSGTSAQQPLAYGGAIRWNNTTNTIEYYNGSTWISLLSQINNQTISPDGTSISYTLNYAAVEEGIIVSINGTLQAPGTAYTVAGTTITFAEIPLVTDIISVRFIAAGTTTAENAQEINAGNISLTTGAVLIDSFNKDVYRSAKYMASTTSAADSEFAEFAVTQFDPNVAVSNVNRAVTGSTLATITANISGSLVRVYATASSSAQMRLQKTYFII